MGSAMNMDLGVSPETLDQKQPMQSSFLTSFYLEYHNWLKAGAPDDKPFSRSLGLCNNLRNYLSNKVALPGEMFNVVDEMQDQFKSAGLRAKLPFNDSLLDYTAEQDAGTMHLNDKRREWVRKHATVSVVTNLNDLPRLSL